MVLVFAEVSHILYCESDSNYSRCYLENGEQYLVSKTLGDMLEAHDFMRVHRQYLVNLSHIQKLIQGKSTYLLLSNGSTIPVARQQKDKLVEHLGWL